MKLQEMREKTVSELQEVIIDFKKQLFDLRLKNSTHKLEDTAMIKKIKTYVAQAKTVINEKIKEGNKDA